MRKSARVALLLFVGLCAARSATADAIQVTSGSLVMNPSFGPLTLAGDAGFTFASQVDVSGGLFMPFEECSNDPCAPGSTVALTASWVGNDATGLATLRGVSFPDVGSAGSPSSMMVQFLGTAVLPPLGPAASVTAPFSFSGTFFDPGDDDDGVADALVGGGFATLTFSPSAGIPGTWHFDSAHYDFVDPASPSPTPEPATLLLMGGGMLAVAAFVRTRSRRTKPPTT